MPPPTTEQPPSPWTLIKDYSQSVITLASALLALSVTFSASIIGKVSHTDKVLLIISWILLVLVIGFGVAALGFLISYLKNGNRGKISIFSANAAFGALVLSSIFFLVFGWRVVNSVNTWDANAAVEKTLSSMPDISGNKDSKWFLQALTWSELSKTYQLIVIEEKFSKKFSVVVDTTQGRIVEAKEIQ